MKRATTLLLPVLLCACGPKVPNCSDPDTFSIIRQIIQEQAAKESSSLNATDFSPNKPDTVALQSAIAGLSDSALIAALPISGARATDFKKEIKQYSCTASIDMVSESDDGIATPVQLPIEYESQLDDHNEHLVNLNALQFNEWIVLGRALKHAALGAPHAQAPAQYPSSQKVSNSNSAEAFASIPGNRGPKTTRHGSLTVDDENTLLLDGKPLNPSIQGNTLLSIAGTYQIGQSDIALIENIGGSACPVRYYFVTVTAAGATASPEFGTCNDLAKVTSSSTTLAISMPGFVGPFEDEASAQNAQDQVHVFAYSNGNVTEDGKSLAVR